MVNEYILQGRFVRKPEVKDVGGFKFCDFTIAWSKKVNDTERKCFMRCKAWRGTAEHIGKYFDKGQECIVTGEITTEEWEKDGQKNSMNVLNVATINFCGPKSAGTSSNQVAAANNDDFMSIPAGIDEELPFN